MVICVEFCPILAEFFDIPWPNWLLLFFVVVDIHEVLHGTWRPVGIVSQCTFRIYYVIKTVTS
ncbi:hypothetical protein CYJ22_09860 [Schaalia odontolytica]|uniref:Uncharacterized protein n=1 Tax=Schaalia odontolytica TaxID=1660 RepID=A0A2I1HXQ0_9ACTO|nr:hypothetical protein CYJ22_09860 [Schaalia odontolytica]